MIIFLKGKEERRGMEGRSIGPACQNKLKKLKLSKLFALLRTQTGPSCFDLQWGLCEYVIVHTALGGSPVILWISLGGKPKWLPLKFGYHDVMRTSPIGRFYF